MDEDDDKVLLKQPTIKLDEDNYVIKGKYRVKDWVKGGGFGDIFMATHIEKNYDVAIKFVIYNIVLNISRLMEVTKKL